MEIKRTRNNYISLCIYIIIKYLSTTRFEGSNNHTIFFIIYLILFFIYSRYFFDSLYI